MRWLQSVVGALLTFVAGVAALFLVAADKLEERRRRRESARLAEQLRARVRQAREQLEEQRARALELERQRIAVEQRAQLQRDPVDVANDAIEEARRGGK